MLMRRPYKTKTAHQSYESSDDETLRLMEGSWHMQNFQLFVRNRVLQYAQSIIYGLALFYREKEDDSLPQVPIVSNLSWNPRVSSMH